MPTLEFKGKQFVYAHHLSVPFRQLEVDKDKSLSDKPGLDDNLIIHGDNLHALKALLPQYAGKVKCIYIDPPYNTGKDWCYNDNVNSPLMKEWLKESANPVDKDDLERHDKWLCMMWPRLNILYELMSEDGLLFISISDIELHNLYSILLEILGEHSFSAKFIWVNEGNIDNQSRIKQNHEYIIMFCKNDEEFDFPPVIDPNIEDTSKLYKGIISNTIVKNGPKNPVSDLLLPAGFPADFSEGEIVSDCAEWPKFDQPIKVFNGKLVNAVVTRSGWSSKDLCEEFIQNKFVPVLDRKGQKSWFVITDTGAVYVKKDRTNKQSHVLTVLRGMGTVQEMSGKLDQMGIDFDYPKPVKLVKYLISMVDNKDFIVLDSFAGSGTTGNAVLELNKEDGGKRKFILIECEDYAYEKTATRIKKAIEGIPGAKDEDLQNPLDGSYTYCTLGEEINIESLLKGDNLPDYESLSRYVFYTATGKTLDEVAKAKSDYFIGETDLYRVHLIYRPDRDFLRSNDSALNAEMVERIAESNASGKQCLVFASAKFMGQRELAKKKVDFCQLPYAIHRVLGD